MDKANPGRVCCNLYFDFLGMYAPASGKLKDPNRIESIKSFQPDAEPHISYQFLPAFSAGLALVIIITMFWDICVIQFNPGIFSFTLIT